MPQLIASEQHATAAPQQQQQHKHNNDNSNIHINNYANGLLTRVHFD